MLLIFYFFLFCGKKQQKPIILSVFCLSSIHGSLIKAAATAAAEAAAPFNGFIGLRFFSVQGHLMQREVSHKLSIYNRALQSSSLLVHYEIVSTIKNCNHPISLTGSIFSPFVLWSIKQPLSSYSSPCWPCSLIFFAREGEKCGRKIAVIPVLSNFKNLNINFKAPWPPLGPKGL